MGWSRFVSLERTDEEKLDAIATCPPALKDTPDYPWGMRICMDEETIKKLEIGELPEVGDTVDMRCFGKVTSVSSDENEGGERRRIEIQITEVAMEDENDEPVPGRRR